VPIKGEKEAISVEGKPGTNKKKKKAQEATTSRRRGVPVSIPPNKRRCWKRDKPWAEEKKRLTPWGKKDEGTRKEGHEQSSQHGTNCEMAILLTKKSDVRGFVVKPQGAGQLDGGRNIIIGGIQKKRKVQNGKDRDSAESLTEQDNNRCSMFAQRHERL